MLINNRNLEILISYINKLILCLYGEDNYLKIDNFTKTHHEASSSVDTSKPASDNDIMSVSYINDKSSLDKELKKFFNQEKFNSLNYRLIYSSVDDNNIIKELCKKDESLSTLEINIKNIYFNLQLNLLIDDSDKYTNMYDILLEAIDYYNNESIKGGNLMFINKYLKYKIKYLFLRE